MLFFKQNSAMGHIKVVLASQSVAVSGLIGQSKQIPSAYPETVFISMFFFESSNLDLCLIYMCCHKLLIVLLWSAAISFVHNLAMVSFLTKYLYMGIV